VRIWTKPRQKLWLGTPLLLLLLLLPLEGEQQGGVVVMVRGLWGPLAVR
jgi:hypothetical protein